MKYMRKRQENTYLGANHTDTIESSVAVGYKIDFSAQVASAHPFVFSPARLAGGYIYPSRHKYLNGSVVAIAWEKRVRHRPRRATRERARTFAYAVRGLSLLRLCV